MSTPGNRKQIKGRGSHVRIPNRFETLHTEADLEQVEQDAEYLDELAAPKTIYLPDDTQTIVSENDSPDIGFRYSVNPYRGCLHGCAYCYARRTHDYFGLSAGIDFETKIFVKHRAPELLRNWLARPQWQPESIAFSGVTDCYQPAEREFQITRRCLQVALQARQPIGIVTKNALILRDLDLLREMARHGIVRVAVSVTTLDKELARVMEPRTCTPESRLRTIAALREAGVPGIAMVAPVIPGLTDVELPQILKAMSEAGALSAAYTLLRLPQTVRPVFLEWLSRTQPEAYDRVESRIRNTRGGEFNQAEFGQRMRGVGNIAQQVKNIFQVFSVKYGLNNKLPPLNVADFRPPRDSSGQMRMF